MHDFRTDAELAGRGDTAAFSRLYSLVYKDMYRTALYNLRNTHDAADAVSDAVADAFENIGRLKNAEAFKAWIMEIAEISGIKASTVRSKLSRIKEKLRLSLCE